MRTPHGQRDLRDARGDVRIPGASVVMTGDVTACEDVTIAGQLHGTIDLSDHVLTIAKTATVTASIVARIVTIRGHVTGSVAASAQVDIHDTGFLEGNVIAPCITLVEGAYFCGTVTTPASRA